MDDVAFDRFRRLNRAFTPHAPITTRALFRGRIEQLFAASDALSRPGQHVVLYGERGVGKTSLAVVLEAFQTDTDDFIGVARINCTSSDDFGTMWRKAAREIGFEEKWVDDAYINPDPDDIRRMMQSLDHRTLVIFDEFDRLTNDDAMTLMADTLKGLSDHVVSSKVVIVGVADSVTGLIGEHESVRRAVEQVHMPRMTRPEVDEIVTAGLVEADMTIDGGALELVGRLAEGLPHYAHLLALKAGHTAIGRNSANVTTADVLAAVRSSVDSHSLIAEYQTAIQSSRTEALFRQVLTACALADKDRLGYFTAASVRAPLSRLMGKPYDIPAYAAHLDAFAQADRGSVLIKEGIKKRFRFRFRDPLIQPFVLFVAIQDGLISEEYLTEHFT